MAGPEPNGPPGLGVLRRRHSGQENEEPAMERPGEARPGSLSGPAVVIGPASDSPYTIALRSSSVDRGIQASMSTLDGSAPRVRFSTDVERTAPSASNGTNTPSLSINTDQMQYGSSKLDGESLSPRSNNPSPRTSVGQVIPVSPRTRNRGYSLRRSLFTRSTHAQIGDSGSTMELQPAGPSRSDPPQTIANHGSPKKEPTNVTISEATEDESSAYETKKAIALSTLQHYETWAKRKAANSIVTRKFEGLYERIRKAVLRIQEIPPTKDGRHITLDVTRRKPLIDERTGKHYIGNTIRSSRYTLWNFFPRQLFAQFSKLANLCV